MKLKGLKGLRIKLIFSKKKRKKFPSKIYSNSGRKFNRIEWKIYGTRYFFLYRSHREGSTIGNLKNTVHVTWRAIRGEAAVASRENS